MKEILDWQNEKIVSVYDELTLWSAPFGRMLLENIPMVHKSKIVDIGFGTGFPLIELSQRFGHQSKIYGIDIWKQGIERAKLKISTFQLDNIEILYESASNISLNDNEIDLVTSNLGINNFAERIKVYSEISRILKANGCLALTTNPKGTFEELFDIFTTLFETEKFKNGATTFQNYVSGRSTQSEIVKEIEDVGLKLTKSKFEETNMRFTDGQALFDHALIRIGFKESWDALIEPNQQEEFYQTVIQEIDKRIIQNGEFVLTIPMLYLEFRK